MKTDSRSVSSGTEKSHSFGLRGMEITVRVGKLGVAKCIHLYKPEDRLGGRVTSGISEHSDASWLSVSSFA